MIKPDFSFQPVVFGIKCYESLYLTKCTELTLNAVTTTRMLWMDSPRFTTVRLRQFKVTTALEKLVYCLYSHLVWLLRHPHGQTITIGTLGNLHTFTTSCCILWTCEYDSGSWIHLTTTVIHLTTTVKIVIKHAQLFNCNGSWWKFWSQFMVITQGLPVFLFEKLFPIPLA